MLHLSHWPFNTHLLRSDLRTCRFTCWPVGSARRYHHMQAEKAEDDTRIVLFSGSSMNGIQCWEAHRCGDAAVASFRLLAVRRVREQVGVDNRWMCLSAWTVTASPPICALPSKLLVLPGVARQALSVRRHLRRRASPGAVAEHGRRYASTPFSHSLVVSLGWAGQSGFLR
jgi:hypothetical protein